MVVLSHGVIMSYLRLWLSRALVDPPSDEALAYWRRDEAIVLALRAAVMCGLTAGIGRDDESELAEGRRLVVYIDLPTGQVSWNLPDGTDLSGVPRYDREWDGHSREERAERVNAFLAER